MKRVFINIERCVGCKSCEIACAVHHSKSKDLFSALFEEPLPQKRIYVEQAMQFSYPSRCMHCIDAPCIKACPRNAIVWDSELEKVSVNEDRCIGCFMCGMVCPFGAISVMKPQKVALSCDLCSSRLKEGMTPACVEACLTKALIFGEIEELSRTRRLEMAEIIAYSKKEDLKKEDLREMNPLEILRKLGGA